MFIALLDVVFGCVITDPAANTFQKKLHCARGGYNNLICHSVICGVYSIPFSTTGQVLESSILVFSVVPNQLGEVSTSAPLLAQTNKIWYLRTAIYLFVKSGSSL